jgi:hypothetical protein
MLGGVRFAHINWNLTDVQNATTDRTIRNHQGSKQQCETARPREPEEMYADNADRLSTGEQCVLSPGFRNDSGS